MSKEFFKSREELIAKGYGHLLQDRYLVSVAGLSIEEFMDEVFIEDGVLTVQEFKDDLMYGLYAPLKFNATTGEPIR